MSKEWSVNLSPELEANMHSLRDEVRAFVHRELETGGFEPRCDAWLDAADPIFSRKLGKLGWIGMTWPPRYGGQGLSNIERFVVIEELLAAGAPIAAHWAADRQVGPMLLRYGTETLRTHFLPRIARGECFFALGMSEPDAGSDLAAITTRAESVPGGWRINGTKSWTSGAHYAHAIAVLCRTGQRQNDPREGLTQLIVELPSPNVEIRPILLLDGSHHFNEVRLVNEFVPDEMILGSIGNGWQQVMSELAIERSGPERFFSTFPLLEQFLKELVPDERERAHLAIGQVFASLWTLRRMALSVALAIEQGKSPDVEAAIVKDLGTEFESRIIELVREFASVEPSMKAGRLLERLLAQAVLHAPGFTLRGGTTEILRGIIARRLVSQ